MQDQETIFITNRRGLKLSVRIIKPEKSKNLVFLGHGLSAYKDYPHMLVMESEFAAHGYIVVNIDFADGLGESNNSINGITFDGHYNDLEDVINWAKTQSWYKEPFALAGQSLGAHTSLLYAKRYPDYVNLLVLVSFPWIDGKQFMEMNKNNRIKDIKENGFWEYKSKSTGKVWRMYQSFLDSIIDVNALNDIKKVKAKTFLLFGDKDKPEYHVSNKILFDALKTEKEFIILRGVPHDVANTPEHKEIFINALRTVLMKSIKAD